MVILGLNLMPLHAIIKDKLTINCLFVRKRTLLSLRILQKMRILKVFIFKWPNVMIRINW